ncbi:hypothetical protein OUZ56_002667 [Daphnia magna]|uniref:Uncharacterized protein n=1 Tax=Daphnia magna TaxID=35525 RepID=A0ABR0A6F0_9CRUS|nr:hypothetical protein OUZ56_002667 [Daphnia magna]
MPKIGIQLSEISKIEVLKSKYCTYFNIQSGISRWRLCTSMMKIMSDKLIGCLLRYPVLCFKGFFVKKFTYCYRWVCIEKETLEIDCFLYMVVFHLVSYASCEPAACIPAINVPQEILTL